MTVNFSGEGTENNTQPDSTATNLVSSESRISAVLELEGGVSMTGLVGFGRDALQFTMFSRLKDTWSSLDGRTKHMKTMPT